MLAEEPAGPEASHALRWSAQASGEAAQDPASRRLRLNPAIISYAMGPAALVIILFLRHFGVVAHESVWLWLTVFAAIPATSVALDVASAVATRPPSGSTPGWRATPPRSPWSST